MVPRMRLAIALAALVPIASAFHLVPHVARHAPLSLQHESAFSAPPQQRILSRAVVGSRQGRPVGSLRMALTPHRAEQLSAGYRVATTLWGVSAFVNLASLLLSSLTAPMRALSVFKYEMCPILVDPRPHLHPAQPPCFPSSQTAACLSSGREDVPHSTLDTDL